MMTLLFYLYHYNLSIALGTYEKFEKEVNEIYGKKYLEIDDNLQEILSKILELSKGPQLELEAKIPNVGFAIWVIGVMGLSMHVQQLLILLKALKFKNTDSSLRFIIKEDIIHLRGIMMDKEKAESLRQEFLEGLKESPGLLEYMGLYRIQFFLSPVEATDWLIKGFLDERLRTVERTFLFLESASSLIFYRESYPLDELEPIFINLLRNASELDKYISGINLHKEKV